MTNAKKILVQERETCLIHVDRMEKAFTEMEKMLPLTVEKVQKMSSSELAFTELLTGRFSKLQDTLGERVFPLILLSLGENIQEKSFIDRLHMLEKLGYLENADQWFVYRKARNALAHEYPDSPHLMTENLKRVMHLARELLVYWKGLDQKIQRII